MCWFDTFVCFNVIIPRVLLTPLSHLLVADMEEKSQGSEDMGQ